MTDNVTTWSPYNYTSAILNSTFSSGNLSATPEKHILQGNHTFTTEKLNLTTDSYELASVTANHSLATANQTLATTLATFVNQTWKLTENGTQLNTTETRNNVTKLFSLNRISGKLLTTTQSISPQTNSSVTDPLVTSLPADHVNELLYVVIVICFYGLALMVLIASQIRRQKREGPEVDYYEDYTERKLELQQFAKKQAKINIMKMQSVKDACFIDKIPQHKI